MILKVCGITNQEDASAAIDGGATALGFNFYLPSPRYVTPQRAAEIQTAGVRRVGVFVNEAPARVDEIARMVRLDVVQLHGDETAGQAKACPTVVWKAVRVIPGLRLEAYEAYDVEALLLDGPAAERYGGAGQIFDWRLAAAVRRPIILAGGLDTSNVKAAVELARPWGVDVCSRIESAPGKKDHNKMNDFLQAAREALCL
ncbi:MAG TPA: phosphoribosylanthranilate isomerase [Bryobacteraceae bacterium]|nr:phosphoribosylanthranilate isomerase [Bryobacteraceae bacterium]